jgi:PHD/YefM family antitoxin component YafN of YafNO toxin-antitoxin module
VIVLALDQGPQVITRRGEKTVVILSYAEYRKLREPQDKLSEFFNNSPLASLDLEHDKSLPRAGLEL